MTEKTSTKGAPHSSGPQNVLIPSRGGERVLRSKSRGSLDPGGATNPSFLLDGEGWVGVRSPFLLRPLSGFRGEGVCP